MIAAVGVERQVAMRTRQRRAERADIGAERHGRDDRPIGALDVGNAIGGIGIGAADPGQNIAVGDQRTVFGHAVRVGARRRHVVGDVDVQCRRDDLAVLVGDRHREVDPRAVGRRRAGQGEVIGDRAIGIIAVDRQHAERNGDRLRDAADWTMDDHAADGDDRGAVAGGEADRAFARHVRARASGRPSGEPGLADRRAGQIELGVRVRDVDGRGRIADRDGQRRTRRVAIAVLERVAERVGHPARRARIADIAVAAVGLHRQRAIGAVKHQVAAPVEARVTRRARANRRDSGSVGALGVGTSRTAGRADTGDDIARLGAIGTGGQRVRVGARGGHVVDDRHGQSRVGGVAIAVGHDDGEDVLVGVVRGRTR